MYYNSQIIEQLKTKKDVYVLGIESSCDETAAAVVKNGREVLSNVISSQISIHRLYGGVVPEVASRNHTLAINDVVDEALKKANVTLDEIDAIAVTYGAGLIGALLVGVSSAKALAYASKKPLIKVNHIEGHICSNFIQFSTLEPPFVSLVASGGHTNIVRVEDYNKYTLLGTTTDDAIGEAFDKVARLLGLPYPGGPEIDRLAKEGNPNIKFVQNKGVKEDYSVSYSGLKTAVVNYLHNAEQRGEEINKADVCASMRKTAVDMIVNTVIEAAKNSGLNKIVLAGGVACNSYLREKLSNDGEKAGFEVYYPAPILCTDNAVMVATRAYYAIINGEDFADLDLNAYGSLKVGERK